MKPYDGYGVLLSSLKSIGINDAIIKLEDNFDLSKLKDQYENKIDINHQSFSAKLKMFDITSGNALPSDFNVFAIPLKNSFTESLLKAICSFA